MESGTIQTKFGNAGSLLAASDNKTLLFHSGVYSGDWSLARTGDAVKFIASDDRLRATQVDPV